jgi:hypothetical protein
VDYKGVSTKTAALCVALSHDGSFAAVFPRSTDCDDTSFQAAYPNAQQSLKLDLFAKPDSTKIPCVLRIPGILSMLDVGKGHVFFTADGVNDLVALDLNAGLPQPIFLHTGLQATNLYEQGSVLWISGSKGIKTLDVSKWDFIALETGLQKVPIQIGAFGEWITSAPPSSSSGVADAPNLLVRDTTGGLLLPAPSPASFVIDGGQKPGKKPAPQQITLKNPYGKENPLRFQLDSWCDPAKKGAKPVCKPATEGLTSWSVSSPAGPKSCSLANPETDSATGEITQSGTLTQECVLDISESTEKGVDVKIGLSKPELAPDSSTIKISFCVLGAGDSSCP